MGYIGCLYSLTISNSKVCVYFITFCGCMIFVDIVRNLILSLKILCISLINTWSLIEIGKKLLRLF